MLNTYELLHLHVRKCHHVYKRLLQAIGKFRCIAAANLRHGEVNHVPASS